MIENNNKIRWNLIYETHVKTKLLSNSTKINYKNLENLFIHLLFVNLQTNSKLIFKK